MRLRSGARARGPAQAASRPEAILEASALAASQLLSSSDWEQGVDAVLRRLGRAVEVDRVVMIGRSDDAHPPLFHQWGVCEPVAPETDGERASALWQCLGPESLACLSEQRALFGEAEDFPADGRSLFQALDARSVMVLLVTVEAREWGLLAIASSAVRYWTSAERTALTAAAQTIAGVVERDRVGRRLARSERQYRELVESSRDIIFSLDPTGTFTFVNDAVRALGYEPDKLIGARFEGLLHPDSNSDGSHALLALRPGESMSGREVILRTASGARVYVQMSAAAQYDDAGALQTVSGTAVDFTARREEQSRRAAVFEAALDAIFTMDVEGKVVELNDAACEMFGVLRAEVIGKELASIVAPEAGAAEHRAGLERFKATGEAPIVFRTREELARRSDGSEFPIELSVSRIEGSDPQLFTGVIRDITERKEVERRLLESEREYRRQVEQRAAVFDAALDAICTMDVQGNVVELNDAACEMFGVVRDDVLGVELHSFAVPERRRAAARAGIERFRRTGEAPILGITREETGLRSDGSEFPIELSVSRIGDEEPAMFTGVIRDITERKEAERRLRDSEERYRMVIAASSDGIFDLDLRTGSLWFSRRLLENLGYSPEQFNGSREWAYDIIHPDYRGRFDELNSCDDERADTLLRVRDATGAYRTVVVHAALQRENGSEALRMVGTFTDVTERERAEAQRVALARELHDSVVQDLASAKTYAATARKAAEQRPEAVGEVLSELSEQLSSAEQNMRLIIRALRSDTTLLEARGSVSALTKALTDELRRRDSGLEVEVSDTLAENLEAGPVAAATFGHVLREALLNVLHHSAATKVAVNVSERAGMLHLEVFDNGAGFDGDSPDGRFGIVGMRERAVAAGGRLELDSAPGRGTRIVMELPQPFLAPPSDASFTRER